jgi:hypothetical protein
LSRRAKVQNLSGRGKRITVIRLLFTRVASRYSFDVEQSENGSLLRERSG